MPKAVLGRNEYQLSCLGIVRPHDDTASTCTPSEAVSDYCALHTNPVESTSTSTARGYVGLAVVQDMRFWQ